jgi:hypothetical protein
MQTRNFLKIPALLAFAGLTNSAAAFTDCPGFPVIGVKSTSYNEIGCGVNANFRGNDSITPNNRNVVVNMQSNTGGSRRVITIGLNGTHPIGPNCLISRTSLGTSQSAAGQCTSAPITNIEMHIQTG